MNTPKLKTGDAVVMHTCVEADIHQGQLWICRCDEFKPTENAEPVVFLEGFSGHFLTKYLQKVNMPHVFAKNPKTLHIKLIKIEKQKNRDRNNIDMRMRLVIQVLDTDEHLTFNEFEDEMTLEGDIDTLQKQFDRIINEAIKTEEAPRIAFQYGSTCNKKMRGLTKNWIDRYDRERKKWNNNQKVSGVADV